MKKCKRKVVDRMGLTINNATPTAMTNRRIITKRFLGPALILSMATVWVLVLSVITPQFIVAAQNALPIQQISIGAGGDSRSLHLQQQQQRTGGNFYAPQHGYDNNIEFIHDQTESIFDVSANSDTANNKNNREAEEEEDDVEQPPNNSMDNAIATLFGGGGAGDIYLHNGAPESDPDDHRHHRLDDDESLNANQLPDDEAEEGHRGEFTELDGGIIVGEKILRQSESPYVLNTDLEVERDGRLVIEAGVTIEFAAMVGITVRGVITAVVSGMWEILKIEGQSAGGCSYQSPSPVVVFSCGLVFMLLGKVEVKQIDWEL